MINNFGKVAVLFGGTSAEREISLESGTAVLQALLKQGIDAHPVDPLTQEGEDDFIDQLKKGQFDVAFIILHGTHGEDGTIQGLLELLGIPFTGSGVAASALAMDKVRSKFVFQALNLPTPPFSVAPSFEAAQNIAQEFGYPLSVKPARQGSSVGVSRVTQSSELLDAFNLAATYGEVIIEKWIDGADFFVTVVDSEVYPSVQVSLKSGFYTYEAKYKSDETQYACPAPLSVEKEKELRTLAKQAFDALGCEAWGRVDFVQDDQGNFWILEVNTVPGMTSHSLVPLSAKAQGIEFDELVVRILTMASATAYTKEIDNRVQRSECHAIDI